MGDSKETAYSRHNSTATHRNSKSLWNHVQGLYRFKLDRVSGMRWGKEHRLPTLTKKLSAIEICF